MTNVNSKRKTKGNMIGVDIGSTSIKVLKLSKLGQDIRIEGYAIVPLKLGAVSVDGTFDTVEIVSKLKQAAKQLGVKAKTPVAFSFLSSEAIKAEDSFSGDLTPFEIEQQIANKLSQYTSSYSNRDYVYHDFILKEDEVDNGKKHAIIVSVKNDVIDQRIQLLETAGFIPKVATIDDFATQKVLPYMANRFNSDQPVAIFDIGSSQTSFMLVKNGVIIHSENKQFGAESLINSIIDRYNCSADEAENIIENGGGQYSGYYDEVLPNFINSVRDQIENSIRFSEFDDIFDYKEILISGGAANTERLIESLDEGFETKVSKFNPFTSFIVNPQINDAQLKRDAPVLLTVLGLALYNAEPGLNLLPWREELKREQKRSYLSGAILAALLGCGATFGGWSYYNYELSSNLAANEEVLLKTQEAEKKLEALKDITTKRDQMITRMELIQGLQSQRPVIVSLLNSVVNELPSDSYLTNLSKDKATFTFEGKARDATVVADFMRSLKRTGWFNNIFMSSYIAYVEPPVQSQNRNSMNRIEDQYGSFIVTADLMKKQDENSAKQDVIVLRETATNIAANPTMPNANVQVGDPNPAIANQQLQQPQQPQQQINQQQVVQPNLPPMPVADPNTYVPKATTSIRSPSGQHLNSRAVATGGDHVQH